MKRLLRGCAIGVVVLVVLSVIGTAMSGGKPAASQQTPVRKATSTPRLATANASPTQEPFFPTPTDGPIVVATQAPVVSPLSQPGDEVYPCAPGQIKGNRDSKIYHSPGGASYARTQENVRCFDTAADAEAEGYRAAKN
jgi:hypothetical protein